MKLEALIYASGEMAWKFLKITLPLNCKFFDHIIIIGREEDKEELDSLRQDNITCLITDTTSENIHTFDRGAAYNIAFNHLKYKDWVVTMDADVILPYQLQSVKDSGYKLDKEFGYGMRRVLLPKRADLEKFVNGGIDIKNYNIPYGIGYGYFFMFNWNCKYIQKCSHSDYPPIYPEGHEKVGESDWKFRNFWGETTYGEKSYIGNLVELPMLAFHLGDCLTKTGNPSEEFWN